MQPRKKVVRHPEMYQRLLVHLKDLRVSKGWTQAQIAKGINLSRSQYTSLEGGRSMLTVEHLCSLALFYKFRVSDFLKLGDL